MKANSLSELKAAFDSWRKTKRHVREAVPEQLMEQARLAIRTHGVNDVARATKLERSRLVETAAKEKTSQLSSPGFSRLELTGASATPSPIVEVEARTGVTLRVFAQTHETLSLVASLCGIGDTR